MNGSVKTFLDSSEISTLCVIHRASVTAMVPFSLTKKSLTLLTSFSFSHDLENRAGNLISNEESDAPASSKIQ